MSQEKNKEIKKAILLTAAYYGKDLRDEVVQMMSQDLLDLDLNDILKAFYSYRLNPKNKTYPLPAQIREIINPKTSPLALANETASRIKKAISDFGWSSPNEAKLFIGSLGWDVISRFGGWQYICENLGKEIQTTTFYAQSRDLALAILESSNDDFNNPLEITNKESNKQLIGNLINIQKKDFA